MLLIDCKQPANKIVDEFKKADNSLLVARRVVEPLEVLHAEILAMRQANPRLALMADSLFVVTGNVVNYIDSLKQVLQQADTSGEKTDVPYKILSGKSVFCPNAYYWGSNHFKQV